MKTNLSLLEILKNEQKKRSKGGIYHQTQIKFSYNTNRIEGSKLSEEQTRFIYETNTLFVENRTQTANIDDIIETVNHFACFDYMLSIAHEPLAEKHIKKLHKLLKINTSDAQKNWFKVGGYKTQPNIVGGIETTLPKNVSSEIKELLNEYHKQKININCIIDFHYHFEKIHPFQDGNGRVGRLILFKECLAHNIIPFIIEDTHKFFYYRGLTEYENVKEYLIDTCLSAQDSYKSMLNYFEL